MANKIIIIINKTFLFFFFCFLFELHQPMESEIVLFPFEFLN